MDAPDGMKTEEIKIARLDDECIDMPSELALLTGHQTKAEAQKDLQPCWLFRDEIAIMYSIAMQVE